MKQLKKSFYRRSIVGKIYFINIGFWFCKSLGFISLFLTPTLWAQTPLIRGTYAEKEEYIAYINTHGGYKEYQGVEIKGSLPSENQIRSLREHLASAQESYLRNDLDFSQAQFREVTNLSFLSDWENEHRIAIHYSFMRRAQMEESKQIQDELITQAIELDPQINIDPKLFNQKLQNQFQTIKKNYKWLEWSPGDLFKRYDRIKINGREVSPRAKKVLLARGTLRLSLFSNAFQAQNIKITGEQLIHWKPIHRPLSRGRCIGGTSNYPLVPVYFSKHCVYEPPNELQTPQFQGITISPVKAVKGRGKSSYILKNKWFWLGVGSAVALMISQSHSKSETPSRDERREADIYYGF